MCAAVHQFAAIEAVSNTRQGLETIKQVQPDLLILGANLAESQVCELLEQIKAMINPPFCIALTLYESGSCLDQNLAADRIVPTKVFADRLPKILDQLMDPGLTRFPREKTSDHP